MTHDEAIQIRIRQLQGETVDAAQAAEAISVISANPGTLSPHQWSYRRKKAGLVPPRNGPKVLVDMSAATRHARAA